MKTIFVSLALLSAVKIYGQIGEIGGAVNWNVHGSAPSAGPTIAIEFTPVEDWLEIEVGATRSGSNGVSEWSFDLLCKKPFAISQKFEFMVGLGPEFSSTKTNGLTSTDWGAEFALDLMYWPFKKRRFGWYVEPAYDYSFGAGNEQAVGFNAGLLIAIK
ncbi:MAG TPA: hypothetical protein VKU83_11950 [Puia sp.]|nr:hypothetical protein [Puia sp.]